MRLSAGQAVDSNFCSRTHRLATIHSVQTDRRRQTQHCSTSATHGRLEMVIIVSQQSTVQRYAAEVLSTCFYFCCFRCAITPLTGVINYVFLHSLLNNNKHKHSS